MIQQFLPIKANLIAGKSKKLLRANPKEFSNYKYLQLIIFRINF